MKREELENLLKLKPEISNPEKFSPDFKLREYIELRLIADALIKISDSLKADIVKLNYNNGSMINKELKNVSIAEILHDISKSKS